VYIRIEQLDAILTGHVKRGEKNAKLLDDYAVALIDRVRQLESDGMSVSDAVKQVVEETQSLDQKQEQHDVKQSETGGKTDHAKELIHHLKSENEFLRSQLEEALGMVKHTQAMLPDNSSGRKSRWQHFVAIFTGG
jgi:uncharacterized protein YoaH (UPF0181 family)